MHAPSSYKPPYSSHIDRPPGTVRPTYSPRNQFSSRSPIRDKPVQKTFGNKSAFPANDTRRNYESPPRTFEKAISNYKNKRPGEILDTYDDRDNGSTPTNINDKSRGFYDASIIQSINTIKTPKSNTRGNSKPAKGKASDIELDSNNTSYKNMLSPTKKNSSSYIAEKVYSVKMKKGGIMSSIAPLSKSKSQVYGASQSAGKNSSNISYNAKSTNTVDNDDDAYSPYNFRRMEANMQTEVTDRSIISNNNNTMTIITPKKQTVNIHASLGKLLNEGKSILTGQTNSPLKKDSNWNRPSGSPIKTEYYERPPNNYKEHSYLNASAGIIQQKSSRNNTMTANSNLNNSMNSSFNTGKIVKSPVVAKNRAELFVNILQGKFDQINQRNKRIVLVKLLQIIHEHEVKVTEFLERKMLRMKSKYLSHWQEYLLIINLERQQHQQEIAIEQKCNLAGAFFNRKFLRKVFNAFVASVNSETRTNTITNQSFISSNTQSAGGHNKNIPSPRTRYGTASASKNNVVQSKNTTMVVYPKKFTSAQKMPPKSGSQSSTIKKPSGVIASKYSPTIKTIAPLESRSKSVAKVVKDLSPNRSITPTNRMNRPLLMDGFGGHKSAVISMTNSPKRPSRTNNGQNKSSIPAKTPNSDYSMKVIQVNDPNHSFGNTDKTSFEKAPQTFESLLGEMLHISTNMNDNTGITHTSKLTSKSTSANTSAMFDKRKGSSMGVTTSSVITKPKDLTVSTDLTSAKTTRMHSPKVMPPSPVKNYSLTFRNNKVEANKPEVSFRRLNSTSKEISPRSMHKLGIKMNNFVSEEPENEEEAMKLQFAKKFYNRKLYRKYGNDLLMYLKLSALKNKIAVTHRNNTLIQNAFAKLLSSSTEEAEERRNEAKAEEHYNGGLLIKALSGLIKNFVKGFKDNQMSEDHYRETVLRKCFTELSIMTYESMKKELEKEETYNDIVERFRFIVLAEKALRLLKLEVANKPKKPVETRKFVGRK